MWKIKGLLSMLLKGSYGIRRISECWAGEATVLGRILGMMLLWSGLGLCMIGRCCTCLTWSRFELFS